MKATKNISVGKLIQKLQRVFNEFIRLRDKDESCISCGSRNDIQAGHYFSAGHYSWLRFDEDNVHGQCVRCNYHLHGNQAQYRIGLIQRIGKVKVEQLELKAQLRKISRHSRFELEVLIEYYQTKIKSLKKAA